MKYRIRLPENADEVEPGPHDYCEYFNSLEDASSFAKRVVATGRATHILVEDVSGGYGHWVILDHVVVLPRAEK